MSRKFCFDGRWNPLVDLLNGAWKQGPHRRLDEFVNQDRVIMLSTGGSTRVLCSEWSMFRAVEAGRLVSARVA